MGIVSRMSVVSSMSIVSRIVRVILMRVVRVRGVHHSLCCARVHALT
jgi:hypothetical protein